jgi:ankyrin repeat protein
MPKESDDYATLATSPYYLSRYHAANRLLKRYGLREVNTWRRLFSKLCEGQDAKDPAPTQLAAWGEAAKLVRQRIHERDLTIDPKNLGPDERNERLVDEAWADQPSLERMKELVEAGADVHTKYRGWSALQLALRYWDLDRWKWLLSMGADPSAVPEGSGQPLWFLAVGSATADELVWLFDDVGVDPLARDNNGGSVLHELMRSGDPDAVAVLVERGVGLNEPDPAGRPPIVMATRHPRLAMASALLANGAVVDAVNGDQDAALHIAVRHGHVALIDVLLANGANPDLAAVDGRSALQIALDGGIPEVVQRFVGDADAALSGRAEAAEITRLRAQIVASLRAGGTWSTSNREYSHVIGWDEKGFYSSMQDHLEPEAPMHYFAGEEEVLASLYGQQSWRDQTEIARWRRVAAEV